MPARRQDAVPIEPADLGKPMVIAGMFATLETILPHTAKLVEEKTHALVNHIATLVQASHAQDATLKELADYVQHIRMADEEMPMQDYLKRMEVSLAFSMETHRSAALACEKCLLDLSLNTDDIRSIIPQLETVIRGADRSVATKLADLRDILLTSITSLQSLRKDIEQSLPTRRDKKLYEGDMKMLNQLILKQPERTNLMHDLLNKATLNAQAMAAAGRSAIMAVQFQDYHTQLHEHAMRLLGLLRTACLASEETTAQQLLEACTSSLTLSEIQRIFIDNLPVDILTDHHPRFAQQPDEPSIELF